MARITPETIRDRVISSEVLSDILAHNSECISRVVIERVVVEPVYDHFYGGRVVNLSLSLPDRLDLLVLRDVSVPGGDLGLVEVDVGELVFESVSVEGRLVTENVYVEEARISNLHVRGSSSIEWELGPRTHTLSELRIDDYAFLRFTLAEGASLLVKDSVFRGGLSITVRSASNDLDVASYPRLLLRRLVVEKPEASILNIGCGVLFAATGFDFSRLMLYLEDLEAMRAREDLLYKYKLPLAELVERFAHVSKRVITLARGCKAERLANLALLLLASEAYRRGECIKVYGCEKSGELRGLAQRLARLVGCSGSIGEVVEELCGLLRSGEVSGVLRVEGTGGGLTVCVDEERVGYEQRVFAAVYEIARLLGRSYDLGPGLYSTVLENYRLARLSLERRLDTEAAGALFVAEMEFRRLYETKRGLITPKMSVSKLFSVYTLYKLLSRYGESYTMPLMHAAAALAGIALILTTGSYARAHNPVDLAALTILAAFGHEPQNLQLYARAALLLLRAWFSSALLNFAIALRRRLERKVVE